MNGYQSSLSSLRGMVAAAHPLASAAGASVLNRGGNAFDAAVTTAAALSVVEPYMSGPGGMGIAICYVKSEDRVRVLDFVTQFPRRFEFREGKSRLALRRGARGAGLPGCLAGWAELSSQYGLIPLGDALAPAIQLAREGFPTTELNVVALRDAQREFVTDPNLLEQWQPIYGSQTMDLRVGSVLSHPDLARTYETVAIDGAKCLYEGELATRLVDHVRSLGGTIDHLDLELVKPTWCDPISTAHCGHTIYTSPPPSHGAQFLVTMRLLGKVHEHVWDGRDSSRLDILIRACRTGAAIRMQHQFDQGEPVEALLASLKSKRSRIDIMESIGLTGDTEYTSGIIGAGKPENTTSFTTADIFGNIVVITQSLGQYFGSGVVVPGSGVWLNDLPHYARMPPNLGHSGKIDLPLCPSIVKSDDSIFGFGTPGSFGISQTQSQVLTNYIHRGMSLQQSIDAPRFRAYPNRRVVIENRISQSEINRLGELGHEVELAPSSTKLVGGVQGIVLDINTGVLTGGADLRRDGYVALC